MKSYLRLVQPLFAIGYFTPDDGADVLDDHGAFLDVSGSVQTQTLHTHTHTHTHTADQYQFLSQQSRVQSVVQVSHLDAGAGEVDVGLPLGLHSSVLGRLGVSALMSAGHSLTRGQRDDTRYEAHDGANRALTPRSDAGQQVRSDGETDSFSLEEPENNILCVCVWSCYLLAWYALGSERAEPDGLKARGHSMRGFLP